MILIGFALAGSFLTVGRLAATVLRAMRAKRNCAIRACSLGLDWVET
jgi:hypothetical protein